MQAPDLQAYLILQAQISTDKKNVFLKRWNKDIYPFL